MKKIRIGSKKDKILTASDNLRFILKMHGCVDSLKNAIGPRNYSAALDYLDTIDQGVKAL